MEPPKYDFTSFWTSHHLSLKLKDLKKKIRLLETSHDLFTEWHFHDDREYGDSSHGDVRVTADGLRTKAGELQRRHYVNSRRMEDEYLQELSEIMSEIERVESEIADEESERRMHNEAMIDAASQMNQYHQDMKDRRLLMEVHEKLVYPIGKVCNSLSDIAHQVEYLQFSDERWVRVECKKVVVSLQELARGFERKQSEVRVHMIMNDWENSNSVLGDKVKQLMTDMCNSIMFVPRVCMEFESRIEVKPVEEMSLLKDTMNGIRGLLLLDLDNYQKVSGNRLTNFGDLIIQSEDAQPQTSNNHSSIMD